MHRKLVVFAHRKEYADSLGEYMDTPIIVTDDLIVTYRSTFALNARHWRDPIIRGYVVALSRQLTIAKMAGWEAIVTDITGLLARFEPLERVREHEYAGHVLWISFNWYCAGLPDVARTAIGIALKQWPDDARLLRMRAAMCAAKVPSN